MMVRDGVSAWAPSKKWPHRILCLNSYQREAQLPSRPEKCVERILTIIVIDYLMVKELPITKDLGLILGRRRSTTEEEMATFPSADAPNMFKESLIVSQS